MCLFTREASGKETPLIINGSTIEPLDAIKMFPDCKRLVDPKTFECMVGFTIDNEYRAFHCKFDECSF